MTHRNAIRPTQSDRDWLGEVRSSSAPGPTSAPSPARRSLTPADLVHRPSLPSPSQPACVDAETAFAAARIQLRRGQLQQAMLFAKQACDEEPRNIEYQALHAWLSVQHGELTPGPKSAWILATLNRAVSQKREDLDIRMYRARVLQRLGRTDEALRDFSFIANADETNLEAVREVRLHRMRSAPHKISISGVFSKLFTR